MTNEELKEYVKARPYIRAGLALLFYCLERNRRIQEKKNMMASCFTEADAFLTEFEMRRNA